MKTKKIIRNIFPILYILSVFLGGIISLIFNHFSIKLLAGTNMDIGIFAFILLGFCFVVFFVEFITIFHISDATMHTAVFSFFLMLLMLFSPDMSVFFARLNIQQNSFFFEIASNISYIAYVLSTLWFLQYTYRPNNKKIPLLRIYTLGGGCAIFYFVLSFFGLQFIAHIIFVISFSIWFINFQRRVFGAGLENITFALTSLILFCCTGMHTTNMLACLGIIKNSIGWSSAYILICLLSYIGVYIAFFIRVDRDAVRANEYKIQVEHMRTKVLNEQLKPHFFFNSLTTIKSMYHHNLASGDQAIELFSAFLRERIGMIDTELIPFKREIENISRYIDFCNLNVQKEFRIIYDIDYSNFLIPAFSIQPFVENTIKYSRINEHEDGALIITTYREANYIMLRISDNGVGFNPADVLEKSVGIRNACERFRLILGVEPNVESSLGNGTQITVHLPITTQEVSHEDFDN